MQISSPPRGEREIEGPLSTSSPLLKGAQTVVEDVGGPSGRVLVVTTCTRTPSALRPSTPHPATAPALASPAPVPHPPSESNA